MENLQNDFGGPSIYFHQQALLACKQDFLSDRHIELIYATLSAWGMHRMGLTKTKMVSFDKFKSSIVNISPELIRLKSIRLEDFQSEPSEIFKTVQELCFSLKVSESKSKVVGNSKTIAHILPNLVPPVDRQYTVRFLASNLSDFRNEIEERKFYKHILKRCYEFVQLLKNDSQIIIDYSFNTSLPKIFDNLELCGAPKGPSLISSRQIKSFVMQAFSCSLAR